MTVQPALWVDAATAPDQDPGEVRLARELAAARELALAVAR